MSDRKQTEWSGDPSTDGHMAPVRCWTDDLTEAAATVLSKPSITNKYDNAAHKVATWAAKMLDETPIDREYVRSLGAAIRDEESALVLFLREPDVRIMWCATRVGGKLNCVVSFNDIHNSSHAYQEIKTRGQLRMLAIALGIELKESR